MKENRNFTANRTNTANPLFEIKAKIRAGSLFILITLLALMISGCMLGLSIDELREQAGKRKGDDGNGNTGGNTPGEIIHGDTLEAKLLSLRSTAVNGGVYIINLDRHEYLNPWTLSFDNKSVTIILKGYFEGGYFEDYYIYLNNRGSLFTVESGVTLILEDNIKFFGREDNFASLITVNPGGTFEMNGGIITSNTAKYGGGVNITGGTFTMNSGCIENNYATSHGGGLNIDGGIFNMNGGNIRYNMTDGNGGGVNLNIGIFNMTYGYIIYNDSIHGGGVCINEGNFNMSGGSIMYNETSAEKTSLVGGGVAMWTEGTFIMNGNAVISGNNAPNGGGVFTQGTFTMSGNAVISDNYANYGGGVFSEIGTFNMSGNAVISKNYANYGGGVAVKNGIFYKQGGTIQDNAVYAWTDNYSYRWDTNLYHEDVMYFNGTFEPPIFTKEEKIPAEEGGLDAALNAQYQRTGETVFSLADNIYEYEWSGLNYPLTNFGSPSISIINNGINVTNREYAWWGLQMNLKGTNSLNLYLEDIIYKVTIYGVMLGYADCEVKLTEQSQKYTILASQIISGIDQTFELVWQQGDQAEDIFEFDSIRIETNGGIEPFRITLIEIEKTGERNLTKHTISFYPAYDDSGLIESRSIIEGLKLGALPIVTRSGYTFLGWFDENGERVNANTVVTNNMSLTAKWADGELDPLIVYANNNNTLFDAAGAWNEASMEPYTYNNSQWWIVGTTSDRDAWLNPNNDLSDVFSSIQEHHGYNNGVTRLSYEFPDEYDLYNYITLTYDLIRVSGNSLSIALRHNYTTVASGSDVEYRDLEDGNGNEITLPLELFPNGGIGMIKNNGGVLLLRITKIEFTVLN